MDKDKFKELLIALPVKILTLAGIYYLCAYFQFPLGLTATTLFFVFSGMVIITSYKKFKTPPKALFIGLVISSAILSLLFAYDNFISDIRISVVHIFIVLFIPIGVGNYLMKKEKEKT